MAENTARMNNKKTQTVPWLERISYGLGDTASNLTFQMVSMYLMFFYTDVFGISAAAVATLFLVSRIWDAVNDPLMGAIVDRTDTKWGKCRPWFLWMAIPYAIIAILTFTVPDLSPSGKLIWAYVTYIGYGMVYTAINIPISAILPSLTDNIQERTDVTAVRMLLGMTGGIAVSMMTMPLVEKFGAGDPAKGFQTTMILFALTAAALFMMAFLNTRERVQSVKGAAVPIKEGIKAIKGNVPWFLTLLLNMFVWIGMTMKNSSTMYYFQYNMNRPDLIPSFMPTGFISMLPAIALVPFITRKIGKRGTIIAGSGVSVIGYLMMFMAGTTNITLLFAGNIIASFGAGLVAGLMFALMGDTVEFGEWKSGVRAQGLLYAGSSFGVKFGMSLGGAVAAMILSISGYVPGALQSSASLTAISINFIWGPALTALASAIMFFFYDLEGEKLNNIMADLKARRNKVA